MHSWTWFKASMWKGCHIPDSSLASQTVVFFCHYSTQWQIKGKWQSVLWYYTLIAFICSSSTSSHLHCEQQNFMFPTSIICNAKTSSAGSILIMTFTSCTPHTQFLTFTCSCNFNNSSLSYSTCCCSRSSDDWKYQVTPNSRTKLTSDSTKLTTNTTSLLVAAITTSVAVVTDGVYNWLNLYTSLCGSWWCHRLINTWHHTVLAGTFVGWKFHKLRQSRKSIIMHGSACSVS